MHSLFTLKNQILVLALSIIFNCSLFAQENMTAEKWQEDVAFLQKKIHDDYSFLFKKITKISIR